MFVFIVSITYGICAMLVSIALGNTFGLWAQLVFLPFAFLGGLLIGTFISNRSS